MTDENLWGVLPTTDTLETPASILREQGETLEKMTGGLLVGRVITRTGRPNSLIHEFRIIAPALAGYSTELFSLTHGRLPYPVKFYPDVPSNTRSSAADPVEFKEMLKEFLQSPQTRQIIQSLVAQSQAVGIPREFFEDPPDEEASDESHERPPGADAGS
jgi:hypothetical protein